MKFLTWQNPEQLFVAQGIIKVKIYSVAELRAKNLENKIFFLTFANERFEFNIFTKYSMYQDLDFTDNNYYQEDYIDSPVDDFDWMPNLFAKLANHLRTSTSADVIRLGTIGCIRNNEPGDDSLLQWEEVETMRRYIDSVNRGLGAPEDSTLQQLLHSTEWTNYGIFTMNFISDKNLDYKGICEVENTNLSYASMAFLIALVKGMSMINLKHPSAKGENNHIFTYVIPSQFSTFSFASFLNVANTRLANKEDISEQEIEELTQLAFKSRYWKQETSLKSEDSELFIYVLKNIISEILGLKLDINAESFAKQAKKEEKKTATPTVDNHKKKKKEKKEKEKTILKDNSKPSLASTMVKVLTEESLPQTKESLIDKTMQLYPTLKINCFNTTLSRLHKNEVLNYYNGGLIGIKGKRYGRGYKIISRLHKHKETD